MLYKSYLSQVVRAKVLPCNVLEACNLKLLFPFVRACLSCWHPYAVDKRNMKGWVLAKFAHGLRAPSVAHGVGFRTLDALGSFGLNSSQVH